MVADPNVRLPGYRRYALAEKAKVGGVEIPSPVVLATHCTGSLSCATMDARRQSLVARQRLSQAQHKVATPAVRPTRYGSIKALKMCGIQTALAPCTPTLLTPLAERS